MSSSFQQSSSDPNSTQAKHSSGVSHLGQTPSDGGSGTQSEAHPQTEQPVQQSGPSGGIDLSAMARGAGASQNADDQLLFNKEKEGAATEADGPAGELIVVLDESNFEQAALLSRQVPIVIQFWAEWCGPCRQLKPIMEAVAKEYGGRFQLAQVDIDKARGLAQAFKVQSVPTVFALIGAQPVPLFQGALQKAQVKQYVDQLLMAAKQAGVTGTLQVQEVPKEPTAQELAVKEAIEAGDFDKAEALLNKELENHPNDSDIKAALAQLRLQRRLKEEADAVVDESDPFALADQFVANANSPAAYQVLLDALKKSEDADQREKIRERIVELFTVDSNKDAVSKARRELSKLLFG